MNRIIKPRGAGKTTEVVQFAHENNAIVVCARPEAIYMRAQELGYDDVEAINYGVFLSYWNDFNKPFIIDELDGLLLRINPNIVGYSFSEE